ncbi:MAG: hypothetical protein POELPBGB_01361 [Bacteroidia bacterium]|nr:hypothetical protein [Bacteroidia bacterium]
MEILFIWIKDFNNIKEQGFQFGGKYFITYDKHNHALHFDKNPKYIADFFENIRNNESDGKINSVTALVGSNGSGKSSVIQFLSGQLMAGHIMGSKKLPLKDNGLIVVERENEFIIYDNDEDEKFTTKLEKQDVGFTISINKLEKRTRYEYGSRLYHELIGLYYSDSWHDNVVKTIGSESDLINLSNSTLYYKSHTPIERDLKRKNNYRTVYYPDKHISDDVRRQILFITEKEEVVKKLGIKIPSHISIFIRQEYTMGGGNKNPRIKEDSEKFQKTFRLVYEAYTPQKDIDFIRLFFLCASLSFYVYPSKKFIDKINERYNEFKVENLEYDIKLLIEKSNSPFDLAYKFLSLSFFDIPQETVRLRDDDEPVVSVDFKIQELISYIKFIDETFTESNINLSKYKESILGDFLENRGLKHDRQLSFNPFHFYLNSKFGYEFLNKYLHHLFSEVTIDYLQFNPLELSTGEIAFLNILSRINCIGKEEVNHYNRFKYMKYTGAKNILFFIDEGEAHFHPQWQKKFLELLLNVLPGMFQNKTIQLILTSHSPLFLSDLPRENINFLKRNEATGLCEVSDLESRKDTLGANIHTLFADSFFIQGGLIGDFAKNKINETIKLLQDGSTEKIYAKKDEIKKIIRMIGEPIIRNKLLQLLNERIDVDERINDLQRQLDKLKNKRND